MKNLRGKVILFIVSLTIVAGTVSAAWAQLEKGDSPWSGEVTAGYIFVSGTTDSQNGSLSLETVRKSDIDKLTIKAQARYGKSEDVETANAQEGSLKLDRFLAGEKYIYGLLGLLHDKVNHIDIRYWLGIGAGYLFLKDERRSLEAEAGLEVSREANYDQLQDVETFVSLAGLYKQRISEAADFSQQLHLFPNLTESDAYRIKSVSALSTKVTEKVFIRLSVTITYDNEPPLDTEQMETRAETSLLYSF